MSRLDEHCPVNLGDTWADVQVALGITAPLEPYFNEPTTRNGWHCHLASRGIWLFFDDSEHVRTLRFDAPFAGAVDGVRIGDSARRVRALKGKVDRRWPIDDGAKRWFYDSPFVRFDFDVHTDTVKTILL